MQYDSVSINQSIIEFKSYPADREDVQTKPQPNLGFFIYKRGSLTKKEAFQMLKKAMIENTSDDIKYISNYLNDLVRLEYEEKI